jgi:hypothetical protein
MLWHCAMPGLTKQLGMMPCGAVTLFQFHDVRMRWCATTLLVSPPQLTHSPSSSFQFQPCVAWHNGCEQSVHGPNTYSPYVMQQAAQLQFENKA